MTLRVNATRNEANDGDGICESSHLDLDSVGDRIFSDFQVSPFLAIWPCFFLVLREIDFQNLLSYYVKFKFNLMVKNSHGHDMKSFLSVFTKFVYGCLWNRYFPF